jgi:RimJ/RimL family protein N-acetyltransferase
MPPDRGVRTARALVRRYRLDLPHRAEANLIYETERLVVRAWTDDVDDLARLADLYSRPELTRFLGEFRDDLMKVIKRWQDRMAADPRQVVAAIEVRETGTVAGTILYKTLPGVEHMEVGWHLHPDTWGRGYATESAREVVARGFRLGVPEVFALVRPDNHRSQAVCRRLGMRHLGRTSVYYDMELELFHLAKPVRARPVARKTGGATER